MLFSRRGMGKDRQMREDEPKARTRRAISPLTIVAATIPLAMLLYALSPIPVFFILNRSHGRTPPPVFRFYKPFRWTERNTPLKGPIDRYSEFVGRLER